MNFNPNSKILIVGEGNFSFALSLCTMKFCNAHQLLATCFEREDSLTPISKENSEILKSKGASVLFKIDGRKLEDYFNTLFSLIVFNFPHSGGKMKIQNNRQLLKEFFESAAHVLSQDGVVCVSLCSGQGGIPLDTTLRGWNDTWQIVPMATCGDLILISINFFEPGTYVGYVCTGYRSLGKGFHQEGSLLYKFIKNVFRSCNINPLDCVPIHLHDGTTVNIPKFINLLLQRNIFSENGSFVHFVFNYILGILTSSFIVRIEDKPVKIFAGELSGKMIIEYRLPKNNELIVHPIMLVNTSKELIPYCAICGTENLETLLHTFINIKFSLNVFNKSKSWIPYWKTFSFNAFSFGEQIKLVDHDNILVYFVNLKKLLCMIFDLQNHELWSKQTNIFVNDNGVIVYKPCSLFPPVYSFHLSFWIPKSSKYDLEMFRNKVIAVIINTVQDSLVNYSLLETYKDVRDRTSETYEINYCSLDKALSKQKAKELHEKVGRRLKFNLDCDIR